MISQGNECRLDTPTPGPDSNDVNKSRLDLLVEVSKKVNSSSRLDSLLSQVIKMTQCTLNASAASVLLFGKDQELYFKVASGPVGEVLKRVKVNTENGVAGWVARTGKPAIVNDVNCDQRFDRLVDEVTGFMTMSLICVPLVIHKKVIGVLEVLNKLDGTNFNEEDLESVISVATTAAMAIENAQLHQTVFDAYKSTIRTLAAAIDAKDPYTCGHSQRVMQYALIGGNSLFLSAGELEILEHAATLHDVGKIAIDEYIINKPDALNHAEWEIMYRHPIIGANMLKKIPFLEKSSDLILYHHEWYDGKGYPTRRKGEDIPRGSRLIAVADAFDTMTTNRAYRQALKVEDAISELQRCASTQFCPVAVEAFISGYNLSVKKCNLSFVSESV